MRRRESRHSLCLTERGRRISGSGRKGCMKVSSHGGTGFEARLESGTGVTRTAGSISGVQADRKNAFRMQKTQNKVVKKRVNYNSREVRNALLRTCKSQSAGMVLTSAKAKLSNLLKCKGTGQYDEKELNTAIVHARRMVRCAQLKVRNLKKEEQIRQRFEKAADREKQDRSVSKLQQAARERERQLELARKRRRNRSVEKGKMDAADEEYKNRQQQDNRDENSAAFQNVSFQAADVELFISRQGIELSEEQLMQMTELPAADTATALPTAE